MPIISHKQLLQCFHAHFCRDFMKLDRFTSWNFRYCHYPLNLNHPNFNIVPYRKNQKNEFSEMTKCNGAKFLPHNSISLTFWTIFFTEIIRYPFNTFQVIGTWGTKYLKNQHYLLWYYNFKHHFALFLTDSMFFQKCVVLTIDPIYSWVYVL